MIEDYKNDAQTRMQKSIVALENAFKKVRTGRAHPNILEGVMVSYYGSDTPINQVGNVGVEDARTLTISVWERQLIPEVEKAIMKADLGLNPSTSGDLIRVPMPPLTEETRKEMVKVAKKEAENARVSVRNIRRDVNNDLKALLKDKEITEDEQRKGEDVIQKLTDEFVKKIDDLLKLKEQDLMDV